MTMCLSLAVTDTTSQMGLESVSIKWPNDLVVEAPEAPLGYRKLGGILAETAVSPRLGDCVILGLGLNVNWRSMPDELSDTAASLSALLTPEDADGAIDLDDVVIGILGRLDDTWLPAVEGSANDLEKLFDAYRQRCSTLRRKVRIEVPDGIVVGTATDVAADGALVVTGPDGVRRITVGDVVHLRPEL